MNTTWFTFFGRSFIICFISSSKFASNILSASSIIKHCKSKKLRWVYKNIHAHIYAKITNLGFRRKYWILSCDLQVLVYEPLGVLKMVKKSTRCCYQQIYSFYNPFCFSSSSWTTNNQANSLGVVLEKILCHSMSLKYLKLDQF